MKLDTECPSETCVCTDMTTGYHNQLNHNVNAHHRYDLRFKKKNGTLVAIIK